MNWSFVKFALLNVFMLYKTWVNWKTTKTICDIIHVPETAAAAETARHIHGMEIVRYTHVAGTPATFMKREPTATCVWKSLVYRQSVCCNIGAFTSLFQKQMGISTHEWHKVLQNPGSAWRTPSFSSWCEFGTPPPPPRPPLLNMSTTNALHRRVTNKCKTLQIKQVAATVDSYKDFGKHKFDFPFVAPHPTNTWNRYLTTDQMQLCVN